MTHDPSAALESLSTWMRQWPSLLTAYSGGVDSAVVAVVAHRVLGERAMACLGVSPSLAGRERRAALALAERHGFACRTIYTTEQDDPSYVANPADRCYYCKSSLFGGLTDLARSEGWAVVADGTHADDIHDVRHGRRAAGERNVRSPLAEVGIGKAGVRALARELGLEVWDKPAMACLASRVPHGTPVTPAVLEQVERAEDVLAGLGFDEFRVRHHGELARIEVPAADFAHVLHAGGALVAALRGIGYQHVTLDLAGFRNGAGDSSLAPLRVIRGNQ